MGKLNDALDAKVLILINKFQSAASPHQLWDQFAMLSFVKKQDPQLARKPDRNLSNSIFNALTKLKLNSASAASIDDDDDSDADPASTIEPSNSMNRSLLSVYTKNQEVIGQDDHVVQDKGISNPSELVDDNSLDALKKASESKKRSGPHSSTTSSKKQKSSIESTAPPTFKLSDMGGIDDCIEQVLELIGMPLKHPEIYLHLGISPPQGILLHGPAGCGKTMLANAIAGQVGVPFISISAPSIVSGMSGESEKKIREVFDQVKELAPCLLFIDEIDAITPKRETAQREMERRIVAQLLTCMDGCSLDKTNNRPVLIIGATNRPDSLDPALRRAGRFDREISMGVPDENGRKRILEKMSSKLRLSGDFDFLKLAKLSPGYVGADLKALTTEAGMIAVKRIFKSLSLAPMQIESINNDANTANPDQNPLSIITDFLQANQDKLQESQLESLYVTNQDFLDALKIVQPSSKREGFATVPDVTWDDIGALTGVRQELQMAIVEPIKSPEIFARVGITQSCGVLLYGPPGCGKTLLAKAVSNETHCNFISVKGPELLNKYVGESERAIRQVFARARASSPCIVFFDELDALCPARTNDSESQHSSRLVNTLLTEMDGMHGRKQVYVIAATNRPDMIDPAMLRPGRLDKALYVDFPNSEERCEILRALSRKTPLGVDVQLKDIASDTRCTGFSGADLASLVREAAVAALRRKVYNNGNHGFAEQLFVDKIDFDNAFVKITPSVGSKDRKRYELLKVKFGSGCD